MSKPTLTQKYLKKILSYEADTGNFVWAQKRRGRTPGRIGYLNNEGYLSIMIDGVNYRAHRLAWLYVYGKFPPQHIDHINHNKTDNRIINLRAVTTQENQRNRGYFKNSSGYIGVCWDKARDKWKPHIKVDQRLINLGRFNTLEEAVAARKAAEMAYGFHPNHGVVLTDC